MPEHRYRVPAAVGRAELREQGSRFLASVEPVADEAAATARLADCTIRVLPSHRAALLDGLASLGVRPRDRTV